MTDPYDPLAATSASDPGRDDRRTDVDPPRDSRLPAALVGHWPFCIAGAALVLAVCGVVATATRSAAARLEAPRAEQSTPAVAIANQAEVAYCTPQFKEVLERVLHACGLDGGTSRRGCAPSDVKSFASISDEDFNALFSPLRERGAVLLFDNASDELDAPSKALLEERWADRRGARYFFVVARASKSGSQQKNRALSHRRANSVKFHVGSLAEDPDLDKKVGELWLGNEFAQLPASFCEWPSSRKDQKCTDESINRSAFVSWVDCRL
ncbi:MAG TPA: hypothetical protein VLC09_05485 [Polyangiaceae bacterium]|nr:hypothetical protein [Polyangiaceae bacterium]